MSVYIVFLRPRYCLTVLGWVERKNVKKEETEAILSAHVSYSGRGMLASRGAVVPPPSEVAVTPGLTRRLVCTYIHTYRSSSTLLCLRPLRRRRSAAYIQSPAGQRNGFTDEICQRFGERQEATVLQHHWIHCGP